jgi:hypothetical protein
MPWNQQRYEELRLDLIDRNEARVDNVYLDTLGIPTVGFGVALIARQRDRSMRVDGEHVDALAGVLNLDLLRRKQLDEVLTDYTQVQNRHTDERFRSLGAFQASQFGQEAQDILGRATSTRHAGPGGTFYSWDVLTDRQSPLQISLTHEQSLELFERIAPKYEGRLNRILQRADCPAEALSEEQRAALYSMTYHGATGKANRVAEPIGRYWRAEISEGQLQAELGRAVHDPKFPVRSANELDLLQNIERRPVRELNAPDHKQSPDRLRPRASGASTFEQPAEMRAAAVLADNPSHPDHDTFHRIHSWVRGTGQWDEEKSRNIASALYKEQASDPLLERVDKVGGGLGRNGEENVFAVYAPYGDRDPFFHVSVDGRQAGQQPAQQNLEQAEQVRQQLAQQQQLEQVQRQDQQSQRAAQMAM